MTNAVDILCIGGAADGDMLCVKRAVAAAYYARDVAYSHLVYEREGKKYHLAIPQGEELPSSETIGNAIDAANFPPSWDLN